MKEKTQAWSNYEIKMYNRTHCIQNNNCTLENEWTMARNLSTKISDVARSQYESRIIMNCKNNSKTFWSYVKKKKQEMYPHWRIIMVNLLLVIYIYH